MLKSTAALGATPLNPWALPFPPRAPGPRGSFWMTKANPSAGGLQPPWRKKVNWLSKDWRVEVRVVWKTEPAVNLVAGTTRSTSPARVAPPLNRSPVTIGEPLSDPVVAVVAVRSGAAVAAPAAPTADAMVPAATPLSSQRPTVPVPRLVPPWPEHSQVPSSQSFLSAIKI